jgi:hypothetical protein
MDEVGAKNGYLYGGASLSKRALVRCVGPHGLGCVILTSVLILVFPLAGLAQEKYGGAFTSIGAMNVPRCYHTATLLPDGKVLIAGGRRGWREELDSAELYDRTLHKFIPTGKLVSARGGHTATLLPNGKVLIAGGFQPGEALTSAELYDPISGTFSATGSMAVAREWHTATLLSNGKVLIAGGSNQTGITPTAELYDPATGKFVGTGHMNVARALHYATALNGSDALIVGGVRGGGPNFFYSGHSYLASAERYDPGKGQFTLLSIFNTAGDSDGSAVLLDDGKVLVAGGIGGEVVVSDARLYDPAQATFFRTASMTSQRNRHEATLLSDGRVLVTGGVKTYQWPAPVVVATAELYEPERGVFVALPDMTTPREGHTATLLPGGEVLIAGGERGSFISLSDAELFRPTSSSGQDRPQR